MRLRLRREPAEARIAPSPTCRAPQVALRFSPDGFVDACCVNDKVRLGKVGERSLRDIWDGPEVQALRDALAVGDYSLGCWDCGDEFAAGARHTTHATIYDSFPEGVAEWPRRLEFALSNTCNLQCLHCNGDLSSAIRTQREHREPLPAFYDDRFFEEIEEFLPHVEAAVFIGGEPFLAREVRRVWDLLLEGGHRPQVHVTTNGTIWNPAVERYVDELKMNVAISIDGVTPEVNDTIRVGSELTQIEATRDRLREITRANGSSFTVNHCLLLDNWQELGSFLLDADAKGDWVHVIPVFFPPEMSLSRLEADELAPIVAALEEEDRRIRKRLGLNLPNWNVELDHLRTHLARVREVGVPVQVRVAPVAVEPEPEEPEIYAVERAPGAIEASAQDLARWSGRAPLVLLVTDGAVGLTEPVPEWADELGWTSWADLEVDALLGAIESSGDLTHGPVDDSDEPVVAAYELRRPAGDLTLKAHYHRPDIEGRSAIVIGAIPGIQPATPDEHKEPAAP